MIRIAALFAACSLIAATNWQRVRSFTGSSSKDTESFAVASREWAIGWQTKPSAAASYFSVSVHDAADDHQIALIANTATGGGDTSYVRAKPGRYYLKITAANVSYAIVVEDQR
mgnify:CR=1 FL=1